MPDRTESAAASRREHAREIAASVAADLAELREKAGATLDDVAGRLGNGRAWLNKLEMERNEISLANYLMVVSVLEGLNSEHPAVRLSRYLKTRYRRTKIARSRKD